MSQSQARERTKPMTSNNRIEERQKGKALGVVGFPQNGDGYVPSIRVAGKWLNEFGFDIGDTVILTASQGLIVIRKDQDNGKE